MPRKNDIQIAPPSLRQMELFKQNLSKCFGMEHAAALAGIPTKMLLVWIKLGRQGKPGFAEFVAEIDQMNALTAAELMEPIAMAAKEGNLAAAQWVYTRRFGKQEDAFQKKLEALEEEADSVVEDQISEETLAEIEARANAH